MDDKYRSFLVEYEHDLKGLSVCPSTPDQPLPIPSIPGIGRTGVEHSGLSVFRLNAVFRDVLCVPLIPAEIHG